MGLSMKVQKTKNNKFSKIIIIALIVSLVGGSAIGAGSTLVNMYFDGFKYENTFYLESSDVTSAEADLVVQQSGQKSVVQIADQVGPSVVAITSKVTVRDFFLRISQKEPVRVWFLILIKTVLLY